MYWVVCFVCYCLIGVFGLSIYNINENPARFLAMSFYPLKTPDLTKKKNAQIAHAQRRARERLGGSINTQAIARKIRRLETKFLFAENNRITHHEVEIDGKPVEVVYDKVRKVVVTILL